jgi:hypothetical protein
MPRNFAIRLSCPHGDADSWVTASNREESFEQVLQMTWDFKCRVHGPQQGRPREVIEIAPLDDPRPTRVVDPASLPVPFPSTPAKHTPRSSPRSPLRVPITIYGFTKDGGAFHEETETVLVNSSGALITLKARLAVGDTVFLINRSSHAEQEVRVAYVDAYSDREIRVGLAFKQPIPHFWKRTRRTPRIAKTLRVVVNGVDAKGHPFTQTACTIDLSHAGARLDGVGFLTAPGQTIEVRRLWRKARFRVIWIGQVGSDESNQVGVLALQADKNIWHVPLPGTDDPSEPPNK